MDYISSGQWFQTNYGENKLIILRIIKLLSNKENLVHFFSGIDMKAD